MSSKSWRFQNFCRIDEGTWRKAWKGNPKDCPFSFFRRTCNKKTEEAGLGLLPFWYLFPEQGTGHPLVKEQGENGDEHALDEVQGGHRQHHEGGDRGDGGVHSAAHGDNPGQI